MVPPEALPVFTTTIMAALETVVSIAERVYDAIVANPMLTFFAASSVLGIGVSKFRSLKRSAK